MTWWVKAAGGTRHGVQPLMLSCTNLGKQSIHIVVVLPDKDRYVVVGVTTLGRMEVKSRHNQPLLCDGRQVAVTSTVSRWHSCLTNANHT